jgi:hypothetical protein
MTLTPAQKRFLQLARDNGGSVNDYGSTRTGKCLVRLGLMIDKGGHVGDGFPNPRGCYRRYSLSPAGIKITETKP